MANTSMALCSVAPVASFTLPLSRSPPAGEGVRRFRRIGLWVVGTEIGLGEISIVPLPFHDGLIADTLYVPGPRSLSVKFPCASTWAVPVPTSPAHHSGTAEIAQSVAGLPSLHSATPLALWPGCRVMATSVGFSTDSAVTSA